MKKVKAVMEDQAKWQRSRAKRPWAEKLKESVRLREAQKIPPQKIIRDIVVGP